MGFFAPRISVRLREEIYRLSARPDRAADICRAVGKTADELGVRRPSYEQVRLIVTEARLRPRRVSTGGVLLDVGLLGRPPDAFLRHVSGVHTLSKPK